MLYEVITDESDIVSISRPAEAIALERVEYGNFYGFLERVETAGMLEAAETATPLEKLDALREAVEVQKEVVEDKVETVSEISFDAET